MLVVVCLFCDQSFTVCVMVVCLFCDQSFTVCVWFCFLQFHEFRAGTPSEKDYFLELWDIGGSSSHRNSRSIFYHQVHGQFSAIWLLRLIYNDHEWLVYFCTFFLENCSSRSFSVDIIIMYNIICRDVCGVQYLYYGEEKSSIKQKMWLVHCLHRMRLDSSSSSYFKNRKIPSCFTVLIRWSWDLNYLSGLEEEKIFQHLHSRTQLNLSDVRLPVPACPYLCTHA